MILGTILLTLGGLFLTLGFAAVILGFSCYLVKILFKKINIWVAAGATVISNHLGYKKGYKEAMRDLGMTEVKPSKKTKKQKVYVVETNEVIIGKPRNKQEVIIGAPKH